MPLKHLTETVLVVLLALATIVTSVVVSTLPHLPEGFFPWAIVFIATVLFPALLYPLLKSNRADYAFRALHFAPVAIALVWMFIEIAMLKAPRLEILHRIFTWGWAAPAVVITFLLLAVFCLQVIRRWIPRLAFLTLLLLPFLVVAFASEMWTNWDTQLAQLLWKTDTGGLIAQQNSSSVSSPLSLSSKGEKNLSASSVPEEEAWRQKLREVEQGKVHSNSSATVGEGTLKGIDAAMGLSGSQPSSGVKHVAVKPKTKLTKSGGEMEAMGLLFLAGFAGTVHVRARRRSMESALSV